MIMLTQEYLKLKKQNFKFYVFLSKFVDLTQTLFYTRNSACLTHSRDITSNFTKCQIDTEISASNYLSRISFITYLTSF